MANFIPQYKVDRIDVLLRGGHSIRNIRHDVGIAKATIKRYKNILISNYENILCPCGKLAGHKGFCSWRLSQPFYELRKNFLIEHPFFGGREKQEKIPKDNTPIPMCWPYWREGKEFPDYIHEVDKIVPEKIPEKIRADVCQDIMLDLIEEKITLEQLPQLVRSYINKQYKLLQDKFKFVSLNQPIKGYPDLFLENIISYEN